MKTRSMSYQVFVCFMVFSLSGCAAQKGAMDSGNKSMTPAMSSTEDVAAVEAVVNGLFDAMRERNADKVAALFAEDAILQSTAVRNGEPAVTKQPASNFSTAVRNATGAMWDEKIWNLKIEVNNRLASAWMDYAFYLGDSFSHCGANSFQMFKGEDGWKIIYLVDSRQREGCEIPESVKAAVTG